MTQINYSDIQGLIFSGYGNMKYARYHMLSVQDSVKARQWLKDLVEETRVTDGAERKKDWCLNIGFTKRGLCQLGLEKKELDTFEHAFVEGMDSKRRANILGDVGEDAPDEWEWGHGDKTVDIMLAVFSCNEDIRDERENYEREAYEKGGLKRVFLHKSDPGKKSRSSGFPKEHFGFSDGISQPAVYGFSGRSAVRNPNTKVPPVATGEFILGHYNEYRQITQVPALYRDPIGQIDGFGHNGSYLVFRQLKQDVAKFWNFMRTAANGDPKKEELIAAKCVGRWPSGSMVSPGASRDPATRAETDFDYSDNDPHGHGCPFGAHVRRTNPRGVGLGATTELSIAVSNRHRLLRRGRNYGESLPDRYTNNGNERGLLFLCINANIERQFEFIQHTWVNSLKFAGLYDENDPLIGNGAVRSEDRPTNKPDVRVTIPNHPVRDQVIGADNFVTMRGGAYLFLPGIRALKMLSRLSKVKGDKNACDV